MRGMIAVDDVIASLPKERQKKIAARGKELLEKVRRRMTLGRIRKGLALSYFGVNAYKPAFFLDWGVRGLQSTPLLLRSGPMNPVP